MFKFKMEIALNEQGLTADGYDVAEAYNYLDNLFESLNIIKTGQGIFEGKGTPQDFGNFGGSVLILKRQNWFIPFVNKWLLHTDTGIEDLAEYYRDRHGTSA